MKRIVVEELGLEITRKCNMNCLHCMRGDAQNLEMSHEIIEKTLEGIASISVLVFSGGEPSLNVDAIEYALQICKEKRIVVDGFVLVTNGKLVTDRFLKAISDWKVYCDICQGIICFPEDVVSYDDLKNFKEIARDFNYTCCLGLSSDIYHDEIPLENVLRLSQFSFFTKEDSALINMGRAEKLKHVKKEKIPKYVLNAECMYAHDGSEALYINAKGDILSCGDLSYEKQEIYKKCSVLDNDWTEKLWSLEKKEE